MKTKELFATVINDYNPSFFLVLVESWVFGVQVNRNTHTHKR